MAKHLFRRKPEEAAAVPKKVPELLPRIFLSDFELRRKFAAGSGFINVPGNAIISPLALDWLDYEGIKIIRS